MDQGTHMSLCCRKESKDTSEIFPYIQTKITGLRLNAVPAIINVSVNH